MHLICKCYEITPAHFCACIEICLIHNFSNLIHFLEDVYTVALCWSNLPLKPLSCQLISFEQKCLLVPRFEPDTAGIFSVFNKLNYSLLKWFDWTHTFQTDIIKEKPFLFFDLLKVFLFLFSFYIHSLHFLSSLFTVFLLLHSLTCRHSLN